MSLKILIVDDDISTRKLVQMILERAGFQAVVAESAVSALQTLEDQLVDVILLDILMPEITGIELLKQLRDNPITSSVPVILCTSVSEQAYVQQAVAVGIDGYILKPINAKDLIEKIQQASQKIEPVLEDPRKTANKLGLDPEGFRQLLYVLIDDGRERLKTIGAKVESGDVRDFLMFTRDLSSSAENLGANSLRRTALEAFALVPNADMPLREKFFFKLRAEIERLNQVVAKTL